VIQRTIPSAIFVKPYAVEHFNWMCGLLTDGYIDEDGLSERILECVQRRQGDGFRLAVAGSGSDRTDGWIPSRDQGRWG
jgi:hypothetical protein